MLLGFAHVPALRPLLAANPDPNPDRLPAHAPGQHAHRAAHCAAPRPAHVQVLLPAQLALVEICFSLDIVPRLLVALMWPRRGVSPAGCALSCSWCCPVTSECFLLTAVAWDCYVAICWPLHCGATTCWPRAGCRVPVSLVFAIWLFRFPFCGPVASAASSVTSRLC